MKSNGPYLGNLTDSIRTMINSPQEQSWEMVQHWGPVLQNLGTCFEKIMTIFKIKILNNAIECLLCTTHYINTYRHTSLFHTHNIPMR